MNEYPITKNILGHLSRDLSRNFGKYNIEGCSICRELDHAKNVIRECENFSCFPDIGQIIEGYVQIVTKKHRLDENNPLYSACHLPSSWISEYQEFVDEITRKVENAYGKTIQFEHGEKGESKRTKGKPATVHMHTHIVPTRLSILDQIQEEKMFSINPVKSIEEILDLTRNLDSYFYYKDIDCKEYLLIPKEKIPSQLMRRYLNNIPQVKEENKRWLEENNCDYSLDQLWECMLFRPADRFKSTVRRLRRD